MEKHPPLPMTPFDTLVTSSELQMMKLMLPYTPASYQRFLAFFIKFTELKNTMRYFSTTDAPLRKQSSSPTDILDDLKPYLGKEADTIDMVLSAMSMMDMMGGMDMANGMDMMNFFNSMEGNETHESMDESSCNEEFRSAETGAD